MSTMDMRRADFRPLREPQSWESGEVPVDWKLVNIPIFNEGKKEAPRNYRPVSLTSVPGEVMEKTVMGGAEKTAYAYCLERTVKPAVAHSLPFSRKQMLNETSNVKK
ncbi:hypothetical protein WISP_78308 [Willisornis vidua]|uniref:Uncharacterized protein n=1 Tax=Willisornis vidua TaxID=1566151 RepID=A0ABQ9DA76_9PASS|nr:hypothetical protein WISP_78308 [Willisornis vidua]